MGQVRGKQKNNLDLNSHSQWRIQDFPDVGAGDANP